MLKTLISVKDFNIWNQGLVIIYRDHIFFYKIQALKPRFNPILDFQRLGSEQFCDTGKRNLEPKLYMQILLSFFGFNGLRIQSRD